MQTAVDISYYPLTEDYEPPIISFIKNLKKHPGLKVATNQLTTQVSGEYDTVMAAVQKEMKRSLTEGPKASFVLKVLNVEIEPGEEVVL
ncbi:hypothetical protein CEQ90_13810 [Lewinellaceae bacterium SD302]|nr:hypothetical protein CEQ90_13810 [Lewinellaceae bacterium SD302]